WADNKFIVVAENTAVSAQYGVTNTTSGYEFWFFDPNGSYSFRRFRSHATSDGYGTGALRANHFKVNGWINSVATPHIPANVLLNVRVRGRVAGSNLPFGPACQFKIDAALAACPRVKLQDDPANPDDYSCGVTRSFGGGSTPGNRITANPPQPIPVVSSSSVRYQFRFRLPGEGICIVRPAQTSARLVMNWAASTGAQLQAGKTYDVDVRVSLDGGATWCFGPATAGQTVACADTEDWGKVCKVTISSGQAQGGSSSSMAAQGDAGFTIYPNPNRGDQLFISLSSVEADVSTVSVDIFDLTGKKVTARTIAVADGFVKTNLELGGIANGMYMVHIAAGDKTYTERLVIQR
ncbi:MAG: T9SS type A sorting domain-containing protein, partial [Flavobacteriales bacterium]|nr:T9SS type A sorting domain-containing protein [Flavobacteriales bacterium]